MAALPAGELCARLRRGSDSFFGLGSLLPELHGERTARGGASIVDIQSGEEMMKLGWTSGIQTKPDTQSGPPSERRARITTRTPQA